MRLLLEAKPTLVGDGDVFVVSIGLGASDSAFMSCKSTSGRSGSCVILEPVLFPFCKRPPPEKSSCNRIIDPVLIARCHSRVTV